MISEFCENDVKHAVPDIDGTAEQQEAMTSLFHQFNVTTEGARTIVKQFIEEMDKGLDHEGATRKYKLSPLPREMFLILTRKKSPNDSQLCNGSPYRFRKRKIPCVRFRRNESSRM